MRRQRKTIYTNVRKFGKFSSSKKQVFSNVPSHPSFYMIRDRSYLKEEKRMRMLHKQIKKELKDHPQLSIKEAKVIAVQELLKNPRFTSRR